MESLAKKKASAAEALSSFSKTAFWKELKPNEAAVEEPANPTFKIQRVCAPTVPKVDAGHVPVKHDFDHTNRRERKQTKKKEV